MDTVRAVGSEMVQRRLDASVVACAANGGTVGAVKAVHAAEMQYGLWMQLR